MRRLSSFFLLACLTISLHSTAGQFGPPPGPPPMNGPAPKSPDVTIQWFATLDSARQESLRTGRPILVISGTPHCSGISGIW